MLEQKEGKMLKEKPIENKEMVKEIWAIADKIKEKNQQRHYFFPELINQLGLKVGAEIGVDGGNFSEVLLNRSELEKLYCVDIWQNDAKYKEATDRLARFGDKVKIIKNLSIEAGKQIENGSLDFVYIDGDHSLEGIYVDLRVWIHKLRIGGIISGHDYKDGRGSGTVGWFGRHLRNKVKIVVDDFCPRYGYNVKTIQGRVLNWWLVKNRECEAELKLAY